MELSLVQIHNSFCCNSFLESSWECLFENFSVQLMFIRNMQRKSFFLFPSFIDSVALILVRIVLIRFFSHFYRLQSFDFIFFSDLALFLNTLFGFWILLQNFSEDVKLSYKTNLERCFATLLIEFFVSFLMSILISGKLGLFLLL